MCAYSYNILLYHNKISPQTTLMDHANKGIRGDIDSNIRDFKTHMFPLNDCTNHESIAM